MNKRMTLLSLVLCCTITGVAHAQTVVTKERVISDVTTPITLTLNPSTVRCSDIGYGNMQLKVSVPELSYLAVFNHTNFGENLPCITAGRCTDGNQPSDIISNTNPTEEVQIRVKRVETLTLDQKFNTCLRSLDEHVSTQIRGKPFNHHRSAELTEVPLSICDQL